MDCHLKLIGGGGRFQVSSVAREGGNSPIPIGMLTKMQIGKNTTFLAILRLFYSLEWTK